MIRLEFRPLQTLGPSMRKLTLSFGSLVLCLASGAHAADRLVPAQYSTIQAAVNASLNGDRVLVSRGTYNESVSISNKRVSIIGVDGPSVTTIDRLGAGGRVFDFTGYTGVGVPILVQGFTITRCSDSAIAVGGPGSPSLSVRDVRVAAGSRGIYFESAGSLIAERFQAVLMSNTGGGAYLRPGVSASFDECVFSACRNHEGAAIFGESGNQVVLADSSFSNCTGVQGVVRLGGSGGLTATDCVWSSCAGGPRGCIYLLDSTTAVITACRFFDNGGTDIWSTSTGLVKILDCTHRCRDHSRYTFLYTATGPVEIEGLVSERSGGYVDSGQQGGFILSEGGLLKLSDCSFSDISIAGDPANTGGFLRAYGGGLPVVVERCSFAFSTVGHPNQSAFLVEGRPFVLRDSTLSSGNSAYFHSPIRVRWCPSVEVTGCQVTGRRVNSFVDAENVLALTCRQSVFRRVNNPDWGSYAVYMHGSSQAAVAVIEDSTFGAINSAVYRQPAAGGSSVTVRGCFFQDSGGGPSAIYSANLPLAVYESMFRSGQFPAISVDGGNFAMLGGNHFCGTESQELGSLAYIVKAPNTFSANCAGDCDSDGVPDLFEIESGLDTDCNGNGIPDSCDSAGAGPDCNQNGVPDLCDIANGSPDCDSNGVPDSCQADCDQDGIPDTCEITGGAADCNANGIPDACEPDCDSDGIPNPCEILAGAPDCDEDGVPDACEIAAAPSLDFNRDSVLDSCQPDMQFAGLQLEIVPIRNRGTDDLFPAGSVCYRLFARVTDGAASVTGVFGNLQHPMVVESAGGFWQSPFGGNYSSQVACSNPAALPSYKYDSWFGIGLDCADGNATQHQGMDLAAFNSGGGVNDADGIVYVVPGSPQAAGGEAKRVLLAQLTTTLPVFPSGRVNVVGRSSLGVGEAHSWRAYSQQIPMPALVDCNGNGEHDAFDIARGNALDCDQSGVPDSCEHPSASTDCNGNGISDLCDCYSGFSSDINTNNVPDECECSGDVDANGRVDVDDLVWVLVSWGDGAESDADLNSDGIVNGQDLVIVLNGWGSCL